ncbi:MAG: hypothetical protein A3D28_04875 [Omnitrophica bacterium RIFCSPHIGHO2_02_FULL_63_14]|nr:MAG: hypothetical protein A3D28_04875 [Omnitrophica bacterium RIFCSPHIGHO2_02_FULL_63_14]
MRPLWIHKGCLFIRGWRMGMRWVMAVVGLGMSSFLAVPSGLAADGTSAEAAEPSGAPGIAVEQIREAITAESDPELRAAMEEQLHLLESGELDFQTLERGPSLGAPAGAGEIPGGRVADTFPGGGVVGPPVDIGRGGTGGQTGGDSLPPEARAELEKIFSQGTGDPSKDGHLREQAEKVFEKYGVEGPTRIDGDHDSEGQVTAPREAFERWERSGGGQQADPATREQYREMSEQYQAEFERGGGVERGMEHMAPEAREQMERVMNERDMQGHEMERGGMEREMMERELGGPSSERSYEAPTREYEAPTHEYEVPTREYEAPTREYEAPTHEYEAPTHEYEAPTHEPEAPTYEAPTHEYEAPTGPGDGSGMGPQ